MGVRVAVPWPHVTMPVVRQQSSPILCEAETLDSARVHSRVRSLTLRDRVRRKQQFHQILLARANIPDPAQVCRDYCNFIIISYLFSSTILIMSFCDNIRYHSVWLWVMGNSCTSVFPNTGARQQQEWNKIKKQTKTVRREAWVWNGKK